jgi:hypothetical protein
MTVQIQIRRDTTANWAAVTPSPVLAEGELGLDTDSGEYKLGDGITSWDSLPVHINGESQISLNGGGF